MTSLDEARTLTERGKRSLNDFLNVLAECYEREGWRVMGYESWRAWATTEFDMSTSYAYRKLHQAKVIRQFSPIGENLTITEHQAKVIRQFSPIGENLTITEHQARQLRSPEAQAEVAERIAEGTEPQEAVRQVVDSQKQAEIDVEDEAAPDFFDIHPVGDDEDFCPACGADAESGVMECIPYEPEPHDAVEVAKAALSAAKAFEAEAKQILESGPNSEQEGGDEDANVRESAINEPDALGVGNHEGSSDTGESVAQEGQEPPEEPAAPEPAYAPWMPDWFSPITALEGFKHGKHDKAIATIEVVCGNRGANVADVAAAFCAYWPEGRQRHGWTNPVATLRNERVLNVQINKVLAASGKVQDVACPTCKGTGFVAIERQTAFDNDPESFREIEAEYGSED